MAFIQGAGAVPLLGGTSLGTSALGPGPWVPIHSKIRNVTFQGEAIGSSIGTSISGVVRIELSNDGINPINTPAGTITFGTTPLDVSPASDGFAIDAAWNYCRGNVTALSTGKITVLASGIIQS